MVRKGHPLVHRVVRLLVRKAVPLVHRGVGGSRQAGFTASVFDTPLALWVTLGSRQTAFTAENGTLQTAEKEFTATKESAPLVHRVPRRVQHEF